MYTHICSSISYYSMYNVCCIRAKTKHHNLTWLEVSGWSLLLQEKYKNNILEDPTCSTTTSVCELQRTDGNYSYNVNVKDFINILLSLCSHLKILGFIWQLVPRCSPSLSLFSAKRIKENINYWILEIILIWTILIYKSVIKTT